MQLMIPPGRLDRPVDHETDHVLGPADAEITLVEYGSYACQHYRAANERIEQARDQPVRITQSCRRVSLSRSLPEPDELPSLMLSWRSAASSAVRY